MAAAGLILLTVLPECLGDPFVGLLIAVMIYAIGGGLLEVLVSPVVEACPTDNKEKAMSLLHSFYCWGHVGVVLLSTLFFRIFGIANWKYMALVWALIPIANGIFFTRVPIAPLLDEGEKGLTMGELFKKKLFWVLMLMMLCAGASEQAVSQWASIWLRKALESIKLSEIWQVPWRLQFLWEAQGHFMGNLEIKSIWNALCNTVQFCAWFPI